MHFIGLTGLPETLLHKHNFPLFDDLQKMFLYNFALIGGAFHLVFCIISSVVFSVRNGSESWKSNTLEWTTPEHIHGNWGEFRRFTVGLMIM
jgi:cytochrome c oxidase subunit 1